MSGGARDLPDGSYDAFTRVYDAAGFDRFSLSLADRIEKVLRREGARRVADLACGTGSLLLLLARSFPLAAGIDRSPAMIARARAKGAARTAAAAFEAPPFRISFDAALCLYDSLNYCEGAAGLEFAFAGIRRIVRPGGLFLFDLNAEEAYRAVWGGGAPFRAETPEGILVIRSSYDRRARLARASVEVETVEEGKTVLRRSIHRQCFHSNRRVEETLRRTGWSAERKEPIDPFPGREASIPGGKTFWIVRALPAGETE